MVIDEKLNKLYNLIINNQDITSRKLAECGFNPNEVVALLNDNIIKRDEKGLFYLQGNNELFNYGKRLLFANEDKKALTCFEKCIALNFNVESCLFNLFYLNIKQKNYEKAFSYFKQNYGNEDYINDDNYYLYLLNHVINLPDMYKQIADEITFDKIKANDEQQNEIRLLSLNKEFGLALEKYNVLIDLNNGITFNDIIIKDLLEEIIKKFKIKKVMTTDKDEEKQFLEDFEIAFKNNDIANALILLQAYLSKVSKEKYIPMIVNLIELNLIDNYPKKDTIVQFLNYMLNGVYTFDFHKNIKYINDEILYNYREKFIFQLNLLANLKNFYKNDISDLDFEKAFLANKNNIREIINNNMDKLQTYGILCLKVPNEDILDIIDIINDLDCLLTVVDSKRIILRYAPFKNENGNYNEIYRLAQKEYQDKEYKDSIQHFKQLLSFKKINANIYLYLGLAYLKTGSKMAAINYLTIAIKLDKRFENFINLLKQLKNNVKTNDDYDGSDKKTVKLTEDDFNESIIYPKNIEEVTKLLNNGLSFDEACQNLDEDNKNLIALRFAIDCYQQGDIEKGDYYLKTVIKSKQKSDYVRKKILEIQKNKFFYQNRTDEDHKPLLK